MIRPKRPGVMGITRQRGEVARHRNWASAFLPRAATAESRGAEHPAFQARHRYRDKDRRVRLDAVDPSSCPGFASSGRPCLRSQYSKKADLPGPAWLLTSIGGNSSGRSPDGSPREENVELRYERYRVLHFGTMEILLPPGRVQFAFLVKQRPTAPLRRDA